MRSESAKIIKTEYRHACKQLIITGMVLVVVLPYNHFCFVAFIILEDDESYLDVMHIAVLNSIDIDLQ